MECNQFFFPSQPFAELTVDQETETGSPRLSKNLYITSDVSEISQSSLQKITSLRNCEKGMEFLTSNGCEDEYTK